MADKKDSQLPIASTLVGAQFALLLPDGGSPTGLEDYRATLVYILTDTNALIAANTVNISSNTARIVTLENLISVATFTSEVSNFQFPQPANSIINKIRLRSSGAATFTIGTTPLGTEIKTLTNLTSGILYDLDKIVDSVAGQTIYFTITGTVSAEIYYNKNTI